MPHPRCFLGLSVVSDLICPDHAHLYAKMYQLSSLDTLIMYVFVIKVLSEINAESNSAKRTGNRTIVLQGQL